MLNVRLHKLGVKESDSYFESFKTIISNTIALFCVPLLLFYVIYYFNINKPTIGSIYLISTILLFFVLILNAYNQLYIARLLTILSSAFTIAISIIYFGKEAQAQIFLCLVLIFSLIFFEDLKSKILCVMVVFTAFVIPFYIENKNGPIASELRFEYDQFLNFGIALIACLMFSHMIYKSIDAYINEISIRNDELAEKNKELKNKNNIIESQKNELELFTSMASHDLRSPLRSIKGFLDLIEKSIDKKEPQNLKKYLDFAQSGSEQLNSLILGISDYKSLDDIESETSILDLDNILKNVKESIVFKEQTINWQFDKLPQIKANTTHMHHLFQNLVENAIKYNDKEMKKVSVTHNIGDENLNIVFSDNGIGIDQQYKDYVFQPFKKLHPQHVYKSSGVGLSICKKIVQIYNGSITFEANKPDGSRFIVCLPKEIVV